MEEVPNRSRPSSAHSKAKSSREGSVRSFSSSRHSRQRNSKENEVYAWPDHRKYNRRSLLLFSLKNPFRRALIAAIEWKWWDRTVLGVIMINSGLLAYYQPYDVPELRPNDKERKALEYVSKGFSAFFAGECLVKVFALGFFYGKGTYLSDSWNYLDLFIVIIGLLDFFPSGGSMGNLSALRSLRVLRPLRAITRFPQLKMLVGLLLKCIPMLGNVIGLLTFIFFIFGILGVQLFGGQLRGGCYDIDNGGSVSTPDGGPCSFQKSGMNICSYGQECLLLNSNPNNDMTSFDSIMLAFICIFQLMTYNGWTDVLYPVQDAYSRWMFAYFMFLILVGPVFAVQLFLVVIAKTYAIERAQKSQIAAPDAAEYPEVQSNKVHPGQVNGAEAGQLNGQTNSLSERISVNGAGMGGAMDDAQLRGEDSGSALQTKSQYASTSSASLDPNSKSMKIDIDGEGDREDILHASVNTLLKMQESEVVVNDHPTESSKPLAVKKQMKKTHSTISITSVRKKFINIATSNALEHFILIVIVVNTVIMGMDLHCDFCKDGFCAVYKGALESTNIFFNAVFLFELTVKLIGYGPMRYLSSPMSWLDVAIVAVGMAEIQSTYSISVCLLRKVDCQEYEACEGGGGVSALRTFRLVRIVKLLRAFPDVQKQVAAIVTTLSSVAALIALISIFLLIFCILGMNLMGGSLLSSWPGLLERGTEVFVRIPGDSLVKSPFPVLGRRGVITVYSSNRTSRPWGVCVMYGKELEGLGGMLDSNGCTWADAIETSGMHTPGLVGLMERDHYDDLGHAFISTFGVLTGSNWNSQAYNSTFYNGKLIFLFYIAWIVLGNWMLLNLFVAILIQGFAEEKKKKHDSQRTQFAKKIMEKLGGTSEDQLSKQMFDLFQKVDKDGSGLVDLSEMEVLLKECEVVMDSKDLIALFSKYDVDGSGEISFNEFFAMIQELIEAAKAEMARAAQEDGSDFMDEGGKSEKPGASSIMTMSKEDIKKAIEEAERLVQEAEQKKIEAEKRIARQRARFAHKIMDKLGSSSEQDLSKKMFELFEEADEDGSGLIDFEEMKALLAKCEVEMDANDLEKLFSKYDDDGSGEISFKEFFLMIKELIDVANSFLGEVGELDDAGNMSPIKGAASPVRISLAQDMDAAYQEAEQLALEAEKRRQQLKGTLGNSEEGGAEPEGDEARKTRTAMPRSLGCLGPNNLFRRASKAFLDFPPHKTENKWFDTLILIGILMSSALLALDNPGIGSDSPMLYGMDCTGLALNGLFLVECISKVIVLSFKGYISSGWNKLDFLIVSTSCLDMGLTYGLQGQKINISALKIFRMLRILRALRPLRIIARAKGLKILVSTLMSAAKPIVNTVAIALGVFSIYGILGMQFLLGRLYSCSDPTIFQKEDCVGVDSSGSPLLWMSYPVNFDNLYRAVRSMFILATQDDWQSHMWAGIDSTTKTTGPIQNHNPHFALFYLGAILVAGYLVINIFVGVFVDSYNLAAEKMDRASVSKPEPPAKLPVLDEEEPGGSRAEVCEVVTATNFDLFIAFFIVTNVVTMAFESFKQAKWQEKFGATANMFYSLVFGWECAFKMFAFHPQRYYKAGWNRFDFFIVMVTFGGVVIDSLGNLIKLDPTILRVLRIFRIFRILRAFRIFKAAKGLQAIVATLVRSLPALGNLFAMLGLFFFIFSILGVTLFGSLCTFDDIPLSGLRPVRCAMTQQQLSSLANFAIMGNAFATLFRCATGDAWGTILYACSAVAPPRDPIGPILWQQFQSLNGSAPPPAQQASYSALDFARLAIAGWNSSVTMGSGTYPDPAVTAGWPTPTPEAGSWLALATAALPECLTDEEAVALEETGHLDCSVGQYARACMGTCGDAVIPTVYFFVFCVVASFVLLQLVIAVLMDQLNGAEDDAELERRTPGCMHLRMLVFNRMCRRWRGRALRKLSHIAARRRRVAKRKLEAAAGAAVGLGPGPLAAAPMLQLLEGPR